MSVNGDPLPEDLSEAIETIRAIRRERHAAAGGDDNGDPPAVTSSQDGSPRGRNPEQDAALHAQVEAVQKATSELYRVVAECRQAGYSYADIGVVLGVSRQAAWERFHTYVDRQELAKGSEW